MAITVRPAIEDDLPVLRANQARPDLDLVDEHFQAQTEGRLVYAVALDGDEPIGTALLDYSSDLAPELRNMYVYPEHRRKGAGRALSTWIEQQAREAGHNAVFLAVDPNNERAVPLYVSLEYHPTGEHLFVEEPEVHQVTDEESASEYYAIYKKSLTAR